MTLYIHFYAKAYFCICGSGSINNWNAFGQICQFKNQMNSSLLCIFSWYFVITFLKWIRSFNFSCHLLFYYTFYYILQIDYKRNRLFHTDLEFKLTNICNLVYLRKWWQFNFEISLIIFVYLVIIFIYLLFRL
jgi:hypothetical protein